MEREILEHRGFTTVDETDDPNAFVRFLTTMNATDVHRDYKQRTFALLDPQDGDFVLDVGCGQGDDAQARARLVGLSGRVVGVDASAAMIDAARQRQDVRRCTRPPPDASDPRGA